MLAVAAATFIAAASLSVLAETRESAAIILFLPLIWSYMRLSLPWMIVATVVTGAARVGVESLQIWARTGSIPWFRVFSEAGFPIALYVALAVSFFIYRRTQASMIAHLARSRSMEAIQHLTGSLAHDFGNVMQVIVGMTQLLSKDPKLDDEARESVNDILAAGRQATELLEEMRDFSRRSTQMAECDLGDLARRQTRLIRRAMPKHIEVACQTSDQPLPVWVDEAQIGRMLTNLCTNARNAMPSGGMLTIRTMPEERDGRAMALLAVSDSGRGIDPRKLAHIFEPFFTWREQGAGMGLGLAIVRSIAQEHRGSLDVESTPGKGTTFFIHLPIYAPGEPAAGDGVDPMLGANI